MTINPTSISLSKLLLLACDQSYFDDSHPASDALQSLDDRAPAKNQPLLYTALVTLKAMRLEMDGEKFALSAGMQSNAEILLGTRTVAEYLLSPVRKAWHEAGRER